ncbi:adenine deaminase C-terminal domain-containing protein [Falsibacillus pallidus]|uniref:adenine deaminase n=1 Tax=Falsibacillus pallidus TaxID=493781 RepID=A0A370FYI3_9BACI|nr:adenine deaminase C-terminal domain-containing protein [Falsibacillus pallidus]RDI36697.1 adenine deaminase [Falsibacillus pallidus]
MNGQRYRWKNKQIREHVSVLNGEKSPTLLLKNARYLHSVLKKWLTGNIWVYEDRIVYVGENLPESTNECEIVDCAGSTLVPGYIEPHVHPFQLYNPQSFTRYASQTGTTTFINDNLMLVLLGGELKAFSLLDELKKLPVTMYWWCRFDSQTELLDEETVFSNGEVKAWIERDDVVQGGELTAWPRLLAGDDLMLHWIQEMKKLNKKIEGHFPGASEKTLAKMTLLGADCDHEAMNGKEVLSRLMQGMMVSLRHSSIRPDLPVLLKEMREMGIDQYESMMFNTDGSTPGFYEDGVLDNTIKMAIESGIPPVDAYQMASFNVAKYYHFEHLHGMIAAGRIANINFLDDEFNPLPHSILSKGTWIKKDGREVMRDDVNIKWEDHGLSPMKMDWDLEMEDLQFSMPFGIEMINDVITKPYSVTLDASTEKLPMDHDESFLMLLDRNGKWRINTLVKGFANRVSGFASSFSNTGDILLIGKNKKDMMLAFDRMKELGGAIVLAEDGGIVQEIPLKLAGTMSDKRMEELIEEEKGLKRELKERGYRFGDPVYSLLFFSSTHLPYLRITQKGMYDVMKKTVLFPTIMR